MGIIRMSEANALNEIENENQPVAAEEKTPETIEFKQEDAPDVPEATDEAEQTQEPANADEGLGADANDLRGSEKVQEEPKKKGRPKKGNKK